jgi:ABC-2 type transport system ATP-binding protein
MGSEALIKMNNVEKRYGHRVAITVDELTIYSGDRLLLLGPNGSGKSTLLRLLAGISRPTSGRVMFVGSRRIAIGFVPQAGGLYGDMTVRQNLRIFHQIFNTSGTGTFVENEFIVASGLNRILDVPVDELSGGAKKLAMLACVLTSAPNGLLLDEPADALDREHASHVFSILHALATVEFLIVSSHRTEGLEFLERRVLISDGHVK